MTAKQNAYTPEELEALHNENLAPATSEEWELIKRARALKARREKIEAEEKDIKRTLDARMDALGLNGLVYRGEKVAQRVVVPATERFDWKTFQGGNPEVVAAYMVPKDQYSYVSV